MALVEDFSPFLADFGADATIGAATVRGVFDNGYADALGIAGSAPAFLAKSADVASVTLGAAVTISSVSYTVAGIEPDGTGMTRLRLAEA